MSKRALAALIATTLVATMSLLVAPTASAVPGTTSSVSFTSGTTAQVGVYNWLSVSISSADGTTRPSGGVQFFSTAGQLVGSASTSASGTAGATASIPWIPTQETTYSFTATFISDNSAVSGSSTSQPITIQATPQRPARQHRGPADVPGHPDHARRHGLPGHAAGVGRRSR